MWLDVGRELCVNNKAPWSPRLFQVDPLSISFQPTIQQRNWIGLQGRSYANKPTSSEGDFDAPRIVQSASQLHLEYARRLETDAVSGGPLLVLLDVLRLSSSSEVQVLNMLETKISIEISPAQSQAEHEPTVSNLLYHKRVLRRHIQRLLENKNFIEYQATALITGRMDTPSANAHKAKVHALIRDFDHLLGKAKDLTSECDRGMSIMMNKASIKEAQKAIVQAERVTKLTKLAFVFVPLSFVSSFFGMNFSQFTSGSDLGVWIWFAISVPTLLLSILFMKWDVSRAVERAWRWRNTEGSHVESMLIAMVPWSDAKADARRKRDMEV